MSLFSVQNQLPPGADPGTLVIDKLSPKPEIRLLDYSADHFDERIVTNPQDVIPYLTDGVSATTWIDVHGLGDESVLRELGMIFDIHPLTLEDVVNLGQRPKTEEYGEHKFVITRKVKHDETGHLQTEQLSILLGKTFILTFQELPGDDFDPIRERLRKGRGLIRKRGPDFLMYSLLDATIDHYFPVMERFGEHLEELEDEVVEDPRPSTLKRIHRVKSELLTIRRIIWPQRDVVNVLVRDDSELISPEARIHLRDCYDHISRLMDTVETFREVASGLLEIYMSSLANRTNEVMKVLTIVSSIFIPLTFIAGVYGMNFEPSAGPWSMPELRWRYGYLSCLGVMAVVAGLMVAIFWSKGWLTQSQDEEEEPEQRGKS